MNFLESRRLLISTLSPVHIGCGEDYDPTHYVIEDDTLYEFEPNMVAFYQKRVGKTVQVEGDGAHLLIRLEIERTFFNPANGVPVLPGSSL